MTMSNDREELSDIILDCGEYIPGSHADDYVNPYKAADAILAAGYRKLRQVTTVEEVRGLPNDSVLLSDEGGVFQFDFGLWREVGTRDSMGANDIALPATVLHLPTHNGKDAA
jgi:hypothetical protein